MSEVVPAGADHGEAILMGLLLQLVVIVFAARFGGVVARRVGQTVVVGEILVGILLGPSLLGAAAPDLFLWVFPPASSQTLHLLSQVGLILLMFQIGAEFDFGLLRDRRHRAGVVNVAVASLVAPFLLGFGFGYVTAPMLSPQAPALAVALFIGTAFSITALPILGRIMLDFGMTRSPLGVIAISAAAINDVAGWLLLAAITALASSHFDGGTFALQVTMLLFAVAVAWYLCRPVLKWAVRRYVSGDGLPSDGMLGVLVAAVFLFALGSAELGVFAIFGGFVMGVLLHDERACVRAWSGRISPFVNVFFLPIFFTYTGLRTDIGALDGWQAWGWCALIVLLATVGKFGGAYWGARLAGLGRFDSRILGVMMNTRALMELVVINVGYDLGVISQPLFTMLVVMAIVSTVVTSPLLRRWLPLATAGGSPGRAVARETPACQ